MNTAARFLLNLQPGTTGVRVQYDGGGAQGLLTGTFQGADVFGNAQFTNATLFGTVLPGITRIRLSSINSVSR